MTLLMLLQTASTHSLWEPVSALYEILSWPPGMPPPSSISFLACALSYSHGEPHRPFLKPPSSPRTGEVQSEAGVRVFWKIWSVIWSRLIAIDRPWRTLTAPGVSQAFS